MYGKELICLLLFSICFAKGRGGISNATSAVPISVGDAKTTRKKEFKFCPKCYTALFDFLVKTPENDAAENGELLFGTFVGSLGYYAQSPNAISRAYSVWSDHDQDGKVISCNKQEFVEFLKDLHGDTSAFAILKDNWDWWCLVIAVFGIALDFFTFIFDSATSIKGFSDAKDWHFINDLINQFCTLICTVVVVKILYDQAEGESFEASQILKGMTWFIRKNNII